MTFRTYAQLGLFLLAISVASHARANNLTVDQVTLGSRNPSAKTVVVSFDISWENSWRNKINHDAVWLTVRLSKAQDQSAGSALCHLSATGINPPGTSTGSAKNLELSIPSDKVGVIIRRSSNGPVENVSTQRAYVTVDYDSCGFLDADQVNVHIMALEMVYIPQGAFYAGDFNTSTATLTQGSSDTSPWYIASENPLAVSNASSHGFRYSSAGQGGEYASGTTFTVPAAFPKGYASFYAMKYEISEGQWVGFVNSLPAAARLNRDVTDNNHKNSDSVVNRNTVSCFGSPLVCSSSRPSRAMNFLSWMDLTAYLDWAGLRPMTELEFEKMSRGPGLPLPGEYAWGTTDIVAAQVINGSEDGSEVIATPLANAHFANTALSGGDAGQGIDYQYGPLRGGIFSRAISDRVSSGGAYYGLMDVSGNVAERVVTLGNAQGLNFDGSHGDGILTSTPSYEGNADVPSWPGIDADVTKGVTGALGSGYRGGSWLDASGLLRISDRTQAALTSSAATSASGGRGVRTYDAL